MFISCCVYLVDQKKDACVWYITDCGICGMTFSKIKNLTSKSLPKTSEAFAIVINLTPSNAWFEGVLLRPWSYQKSKIYERDWSKFIQQNFVCDYWSDVLQLDQQVVNLSINSFLDKMNSVLDDHTSLKRVNKYKLKFKSKPWINLAIQKFISVKNNLLINLLIQKVHRQKKFFMSNLKII